MTEQRLCTICGVERTTEPDGDPLDVFTTARSTGWHSTTEGDVCGPCMTVLNGRNTALASPGNKNTPTRRSTT